MLNTASDKKIIVVMGVSGSGKTTVGELLAQRLSVPFLDADDFHPEENIKKMSNNIALTDEDRAPWLALIADALPSYKQSGVVLACSALKEAYRKVLQSTLEEDLLWMYLQGSKETLLSRLDHREGHFMQEQLLQSQLDALEEPAYAYYFSIEQSPEVIVEEMIKTIVK